MYNPNLNKILTNVVQKPARFQNFYKPAAIRAFYFSCSLAFTVIYVGRGEFCGYGSSFLWSNYEELLNLAYGINSNFRHFIINFNQANVDYYLVKIFLIISNILYKNEPLYSLEDQFIINQEIYSLIFELDNIIDYLINKNQAEDNNIQFKQLCLFKDEEFTANLENNYSIFATKDLKLPLELRLFFQYLKNQYLSPTNPETKDVIKWYQDCQNNWLGKNVECRYKTLHY